MTRRLTIILAFFAVATGCTQCETDPGVENLPPTLSLDVPTSLDHTVGDGLVRITVTGEDPEGGPIELGVVDPPSRADFQLFDGFAIFSWDPIASDITPADEPLQLVFWVEDDHDVRAEKTVTLNITPGNGEPRFTSSPSIMHNVDSGKPVRFRVTVRDDDTEQVALAMLDDKAPDGALFTPVPGENAGDFEWEPTADQLKFRVHSVTFEARDGQSDPVQQKVTILFTKGGGGDDDTRPDLPDDPEDPTDCPREDAINHTPLGPQRSTMDFPVAVTLSQEAAERYDRVVLNYSTEDLFNDFEAQPDGAEMELVDGTYRGYIDNPVLPAGESKVMYYQICAIDDDSTEDDAVFCAPTNIYNSFIVYSPDNEECIDDEADNHSFETALSLNDLDASDTNWGHYRGCEGTPDFYKLEFAENQFGDVIFTYPFDNDVTVEMFDEDQNPLPLENLSDCSGFANFFRDEEAPATRYFKVTAPDTPYQISPWLAEPDQMCAMSDIEPNDDSANATPIGTDGDSEPLQEICGPNDVDIFEFFAFEGEQITTTIEFTHADGDLDMKLYGPDTGDAVDSNGPATRYGLSVDDNETIEHTVQTPGTFYVRVFGYGGSGNSYTLTNLVEEGQTCTDDDAYAGNDSRANAAEIEYSSPYTGLKVCGGATDWFTFLPFLPDDWVIASVEVTNGNLDDVTLKLWDGTDELATGMRNGSEIGLDHILSGNEGDLYISVEAAADVEYTLTLSQII